jgi:hypothetical protein
MKRVTLVTIIAALSLGAIQAADVLVPGFLKYEWFPNSTRQAVEAGTATPVGSGGIDNSTSSGYFHTWETGVNFADNYANRFSGLFIPPTTGNYVFFVSGDDDTDLFISTDATPANKRLVAQIATWTDSRAWLTTPQQRSDQYVDASGGTPFASGIPLTAGQRYFIEGVHHEGGGGDDFAATFIMVGETEPAPGDAPKMTGNVIGVTIPPPTTLTITSQPQSTTSFVGTRAQFSVVATTDSQIPPSYQWRRGGAIITNATAATYSLVTVPADNGAMFDCVVTVPTLSTTSSVATLTVQTTGAIVVNGRLKREYFAGGNRAAVENGNAGTPTSITALTSFETPVDSADNYAQRVTGFFIPPTTGNYIFFDSSDDDSDLYLSTDDNPANKRLIAQEPGWSQSRTWVTDNGGANGLQQKRSDTFVDPVTGTTPWAAGIALTAGTRYYIEGVMHEGGGGDNFAARYKLVGAADPTDGDPSNLTNGVIAYLTRPVTTLAITGQPQDATVFEGLSTNFTVTVQTDSEVTPTYQWRKGGVNIANANAAIYRINLAVPADAGQYDVVVTLPGFTNTVTSSAGSLTVLSSVFASGLLQYEYYPGGSRGAVEAGTAGNPAPVGPNAGSTSSGAITSFETGVGFADNYANRISGFFVPPTTGNYTFFVSGDDDTDLFLSTDDKPANKRLIAQVPMWTDSRAWLAVPQQRSDQFTDAAGGTPFANGIPLTAGQRYFIEGVHHEGGGGDDFAATFIMVGQADPVAGEAPKLTGNVIGILVPPATINITQQPQDLSAAENSSPTFSVRATGSSTVGTNLTYQWQRGGANISGATSRDYTVPTVKSATDNGATFRAIVSLAGTSVTSQVATLTVTADTIPPTLVSALRPFASATTVRVVFSEPVTAATANSAANYSINNGAVAVTAAALATDGKTVDLTTAAIAKGTSNTLTVNGVRDTGNNPIAANSQIAIVIERGALFVIAGGDNPTPNTSDGIIKSRLEARGYNVQLVGSDVDDVSMANGKDIVVLSSTFGSGTVTDTYKSAPVPVLEWEQAIQDDMAMTTVDGTTDRGTTTGLTSIEIVNATHAMAAGFPTGILTVVTAPSEFAWGQPDANAQVVARLPGTINACIYGYDKGALLTDGTAAAERRILFFMTDNVAAAMNADGFKLFDAAVDWAQNIAVLVAPKITSATISGGNFTIIWTGGGTLQSTANLTPPITWADINNSGSVTQPATGVKFYRVRKP